MAQGTKLALIIGALARDPELRYTQSGLAVYTATVAGETHQTSHEGKPLNLPFYHQVTALGKFAEYLGERDYRAGDTVLVEGELEDNRFETADGRKRANVRIRAQRMDLLGGQGELVKDAGGGVRLAGGMNEVTLIGNLTRDPELRYTSSGDAVMEVTIATNERWKDRKDEWQEKAHYFKAVLWRELAEQHQDLKKGAPVLVKGRLKNESWTDDEGDKRSTSKVEAATLVPLMGRPRRRDDVQQPAAAPSAASAPPRSSGPVSGGLDIDQGLDLNDFPPYEDDMPF
ncbi:single-stranded DNA-binding protein [Deinococcus sp. SL84]|uniref:single-stranded DNA-binding protein n=1 Tax=Deinococcus sp. SL84 TaxID=2994663 RepID=UPI0022732EDC|nr:single-stranded DNA-binding protein [Deinococcus sp. SL84]MCY1703821.1 single-stranded DNA-binding protein [Deinococcus sp. SL84]